MWLFSCSLLHSLHKLVANLVCQLFAVGHVVSRGFIRAYLAQYISLLLETLMRELRLNQNSKVVGCEIKTISRKMLKSSSELRGIADPGDNSRWVHLVSQRVSF